MCAQKYFQAQQEKGVRSKTLYMNKTKNRKLFESNFGIPANVNGILLPEVF